MTKSKRKRLSKDCILTLITSTHREGVSSSRGPQRTGQRGLERQEEEPQSWERRLGFMRGQNWWSIKSIRRLSMSYLLRVKGEFMSSGERVGMIPKSEYANNDNSEATRGINLNIGETKLCLFDSLCDDSPWPIVILSSKDFVAPIAS